MHHLRQAFLLVNLLLFWFMNIHRVAFFMWLHAALLPVHRGALIHGHGLAVHRALHLASGVQSCGVGSPLDKVSPLDVRDGAAVSLDGGEVHLLLHDLAFLPGHWSTGLSASPNLRNKGIIKKRPFHQKFIVYLVSTAINLPVSDAVVLGDLLALGHLLGVGSAELHLLAILEVIVLVLDLALLSMDGSRLRCTFSPGNWLE